MRTDAFSKCHPAVNFVFFVGAIGSAVLIQHPAYLLAGVACSGLYVALLLRRGKLLLSMLPVFLVLTAINPLFNTYGETLLFSCFGRPYTLEALYYGAAVAAIFVQMLLWLNCCTAVLTSDRFTTLFGNLIPALSLLLVMVLRMLPSLFRKARQLSGARSAIGKGGKETGGDKLREGMTLLGALTSWALEGSVVTADSMRSRGYGSGKHTSFMRYTMKPSDWALLILQLLLLTAVLVFGNTAATYTPNLSVAPLGGVSALGFAAYCAYLLLPSALHIKEVLQWHNSISKI